MFFSVKKFPKGLSQKYVPLTGHSDRQNTYLLHFLRLSILQNLQSAMPCEILEKESRKTSQRGKFYSGNIKDSHR